MERLQTPNLTIDLYDSGVSIRELALKKSLVQVNPTRRDPDDPFLIFDYGDVVEKEKLWRKLLPNVDTFFAVKSNPDPLLIRMFVEFGRGFDCASKPELELVLSQGANPDQIIFAHPYKQESHLRFAREKGVHLMTFDTEEELLKVKRVHPEAKLVLRILCDDATATFKLGSKFGCRETEVRPLMESAKKLGLEIVGISFHVGSESTNPQVFHDAIRRIRPMFDMGTSLGFDMKILDLGGGFPGRENPKTPFPKFAEAVRKALEEYFPPGCGVQVIAEPGTFYTRSAGHLVANIIAKRVYTTEDDSHVQNGEVSAEPSIWMYYLNIGVMNGLSGIFFDPEYFDVPEPLEPEKTESKVLKRSCLWGPTCDSNDVIFKECLMPEMEAGQFVLFRDTGGYVTTCASDFNGYGLPPTWYIAPKTIRPLLEKLLSKLCDDVIG